MLAPMLHKQSLYCAPKLLRSISPKVPLHVLPSFSGIHDSIRDKAGGVQEEAGDGDTALRPHVQAAGGIPAKQESQVGNTSPQRWVFRAFHARERFHGLQRGKQINARRNDLVLVCTPPPPLPDLPRAEERHLAAPLGRGELNAVRRLRRQTHHLRRRALDPRQGRLRRRERPGGRHGLVAGHGRLPRRLRRVPGEGGEGGGGRLRGELSADARDKQGHRGDARGAREEQGERDSRRQGGGGGEDRRRGEGGMGAGGGVGGDLCDVVEIKVLFF